MDSSRKYKDENICILSLHTLISYFQGLEMNKLGQTIANTDSRCVQVILFLNVVSFWSYELGPWLAITVVYRTTKAYRTNIRLKIVINPILIFSCLQPQPMAALLCGTWGHLRKKRVWLGSRKEAKKNKNKKKLIHMLIWTFSGNHCWKPIYKMAILVFIIRQKSACQNSMAKQLRNFSKFQLSFEVISRAAPLLVRYFRPMIGRECWTA